MISFHKHEKFVKLLVKIERLRGDSLPPFIHAKCTFQLCGLIDACDLPALKMRMGKVI